MGTSSPSCCSGWNKEAPVSERPSFSGPGGDHRFLTPGICPSLQELVGCRGRGVGCRGLGRVHLMFPALCGNDVQTHSAMPPGPSSHSQDSRWRPVDCENWDSPMKTTHSSLWNLRMAPPFYGPRSKSQKWWLETPAGTWLISDLLTHEVTQQMAASFKGAASLSCVGVLDTGPWMETVWPGSEAAGLSPTPRVSRVDTKDSEKA